MSSSLFSNSSDVLLKFSPIASSVCPIVSAALTVKSFANSYNDTYWFIINWLLKVFESKIMLLPFDIAVSAMSLPCAAAN